jgi:hypothetical protein
MANHFTPHYQSQDNTNKKAKEKEETYWAMKTPDKTVGECETRRSDYYTWLGMNGRRTLMRRCWIFYNMAAILSGSIVQAGDKGQYAMLYVNEFRTLLAQLMQVIIGNRPAWDPKAMNNDSKALAECRLARTTLDYYMRSCGLDKTFYRAVEFACVLGESFVECIWNTKKGKKLEEGSPAWLKESIRSGWDGTPENHPGDLYEGDLEFDTYSGIDVIRDPNAANWDECDWFITRKFKNKYNISAKYPEKKDRIEAMIDISSSVPLEQYRNYFKLPYKSDRVCEFTFWHKKTAACPEGRMIKYLSSDIILEDTPLGYSRIPVFRLAPGEMDGTSNGYTVAFDLCGPQEMINNINSTITSLIKAYGVCSVSVPVGTRVNEARLPEGLLLIETVGTTKFELLNFLEIKPELFNYIKFLLERMETLIGVNKPNASASGSAQALQISQSQQFNQFFQSSYESAFEDLGSMVIECLQQYATAPRMIEIVGDDNKATLKSISSSDFGKITKVVADVSDPMSKTAQGRFQKAQLYVQAGQANNEELFNILENGKLGNGFQLGETQEITIQAENEYLSSGKSDPNMPNGLTVMPTDDDMEHLRLHGKALADLMSTPEARIQSAQPDSDLSKAVEAFAQHIKLHMAQQGVQAQPPGQQPQPGMPPPPPPYANLKAAMGQTPSPNQQQMQQPPQGKPGPQPGATPPQGPGQKPPKNPQAAGRPPGAPAELPNMPGTSASGKTQFNPTAPPAPTGA